MTVTGLTGTPYRLDLTATLGSGGEGDIYRVLGMGGKVAKIYKPGALTQEMADKLMIMIGNPPNASVLSQVAWPLDLVSSENRDNWGFIMPELSINSDLSEIYKYPVALPISAQQKINIAQNICVVISEVHQAGYIFGDFNPRNIGLDKNTGLVSFLDTDTYHVVDPMKGNTYRCNVCAPGYAAPELLEKCSEFITANPSASKNAYAQTPLPTFTKETDNFALAIHIFKLLMNGYTPFGGIIEAASVSQASPGVGDAAVRRDSYCFKPGYKHQSAAIMPLDVFPTEVGDMFNRAFIVGKSNPNKRPNADEWYDALVKCYQVLVPCHKDPLHFYDRKNVACPLCEADERYKKIVGGGSDTHTSTTSRKQTVYSSPQPSSQTVSAPFATGYSPAQTHNAPAKTTPAARQPGHIVAMIITYILLSVLGVGMLLSGRFAFSVEQVTGRNVFWSIVVATAIADAAVFFVFRWSKSKLAYRIYYSIGTVLVLFVVVGIISPIPQVRNFLFEPASAVSTDGFTRGVWNNNVWTSEYLNLRLTMPAGWVSATDEEIAEIMGLGIDFFVSQGMEVDAATMDAIGLTVHDMMVSSTLTGAAIQVVMERLVFPRNRMTSQEYIETAAAELEAMGMETIVGFLYPVRIGKYFWFYYDSIMDMLGVEIFARYFVNVQDGIARIIMMVYSEGSETVEEMLAMFD